MRMHARCLLVLPHPYPSTLTLILSPVQLTELLRPLQLEITNDSWQHRHHAPMRAAGGGSGETRTYCPHYLSEHLPF